jgi:rhodanese-related sulfurtransferase
MKLSALWRKRQPESAPRKPKSAAMLVAEARERVECLHPAQVAEELKRGAVLVDLRESEELAREGMIPGAVHAPRGMLEFYADPKSSYHLAELQPERRVILHCAAGGRSALAADTLKQMGYRSVAHLEGGFTAWKKQGYPTKKA